MMASPGVQEFYDVIQALQERSQHVSSELLRPPVFATAGHCLWRVMCIFLAHGILALSMPYLLLIPLSCLHIDTLPICSLERVSQNRAFAALTPNHAAVVLWVNIGEVFVLLGSGLEETGNPATGWSREPGFTTHSREVSSPVSRRSPIMAP